MGERNAGHKKGLRIVTVLLGITVVILTTLTIYYRQEVVRLQEESERMSMELVQISQFNVEGVKAYIQYLEDCLQNQMVVGGISLSPNFELKRQEFNLTLED